ncbi:MAG: nucleotide sugar dehydrogenase [Candidatus Woesearchaeota archaeon]
MNIGIIGMGFVGGTTAEVLKRAHKIYPYDKYKSNYNTFENLEAIARNAEVCFVCVPTPMQKSGAMDYSAIYNSFDSINHAVNLVGRKHEDLLMVVRSTAVSGTSDTLAGRYAFPVAFNPEFLREKHALEDMLNTNRIIIGANDEKSREKLKEVYAPLFPNAKYIMVDRKTAEMIKYAANVMLTLQIAAANEIYQICQRAGVDYNTIKNAILNDERIGRNLDVPGPDGELGFGGKCFPKDLRALTYLARELGYEPRLLQAAWDLNLQVRKKQDWHDIPGAVTGNNKFS